MPGDGRTEGTALERAANRRPKRSGGPEARGWFGAKRPRGAPPKRRGEISSARWFREARGRPRSCAQGAGDGLV